MGCHYVVLYVQGFNSFLKQQVLQFLANVTQTGGNCKTALKSKTKFVTEFMHRTQL